MKKVLIMVGTYYPKPLANGICTHQIALELQKKGYEVHIICIGTNQFKKGIMKDGMFVYPVKYRLFHKLRELGESDIESKQGKFYYNLSMILNKIKKIMFIPFYPMTSPLFVWRYYKLGDKLHQEKRFDVILSVYHPLEAILAGTSLKKKYKKIKLVHYFLDSLTNDGGVKYLPKKWIDKKGFKWETRVYEHADKILNIQCHKRHHDHKRYSSYREKMQIVDIPLLRRNDINVNELNNAYDKNYVHFIYTGALSSITRNPIYLCEMFILLNKNDKYRLHFYSRGDVEDELIKYQDVTKASIIRHGYVDYEESIGAIYNADVLISIGNQNSEMIPSKVFEYISTGKRIIHFYKNKSDSSLPYYKKYPLALLVNEHDSEEINYNKIKDFLDKSYEALDFEELAEIFIKNTSKYSAQIIDKI